MITSLGSNTASLTIGTKQMLNMKVQKNQSVAIGDDTVLHVTNIDKLNDEVELNLVIGDKSFTFTMVIGKTVPLIVDVQLNFKTINTVGMEYALLGFDAPRRIKIVGSWVGNAKNPGDDIHMKLACMTDASLVYYASMNIKSPLEHELFNRFKDTVKV